MTSDELFKANELVGDLSESMSAERATLRATLEVAYQMALLNEQIGCVLNTRIAQIAVRVESGEYPLQVQVQEPQRRY